MNEKTFFTCQRCYKWVAPADCTLTLDSRNMCECLRPVMGFVLNGVVRITVASSTAGYVYNYTRPPRTAVPAAIYDAFKDGELDL